MRVENGTALMHLDVRVHPEESKHSKTRVWTLSCGSPCCHISALLDNRNAALNWLLSLFLFLLQKWGQEGEKRKNKHSLCKMKLLNQACWGLATIYGWSRHRAFILFILLSDFYGLSLGRNGMRAKQKCNFQSHFIPSSVGMVILGTLHKTLLKAQNWELGVLTLTHLCHGFAVAYASAYILSLVCPITTKS